MGIFLCTCNDVIDDEQDEPIEPVEINEELIIKDRPALLFTADNFNILNARYSKIPDKAKGKKQNVHEAWFSANETLQKEQTQWWIDD